MLKKLFFCLAALTLLMALCASAKAATYEFSDLKARLTLDATNYDMVLTPQTLESHQDWLMDRGEDPEQTRIRFEDEGILLEAYDSQNSRTLVITALADVNARELFDVNKLEESERKSYRLSHSDGTFYGIQGYDYQSAAWKKYEGNLGRFLKLKYTRMVGGQVVCRGYQRRSIRNGYTITIDIQVTGRSLKNADEKAADRVLNGLTFLEILDAPEGACKLTLTTQPDREVTTEKVTIAGKTEPGATVTATLIGLTDNRTSTFTDTANSKGKFSMAVTFPQQGTYSINVLTATTDGRTAQKSLSVMYQRDYIPINLKSGVPTVINADSITISGTTVSGVTMQISVSGPTSLQKSKKGKSFSFTVDTRQEGTYQILLTASKKGMSPRMLSFTATRTLTEAEKTERVKKTAIALKYSVLKKSISKYAGKIVTVSGYVMEVNQNGDEYVVKLAVNKSVNTYKDFVFIICKADPGLSPYDHVRLYGSLSENTYVETVEGNAAEYPRFELLLFEKE